MTRLTRLLACWGNGQFGRLGNGSQSSELFPRVIGLQGVASVSAGGAHTAAVTGMSAVCAATAWLQTPTATASLARLLGHT